MARKASLLKKLNNFKEQNLLIRKILEDNNYYIKYDFDTKKEEATIYVSFTKKEYKITYNREIGLIYCNWLKAPIFCPEIHRVLGSIHLILQKICEQTKYPPHRVIYVLNKHKYVNELRFLMPELKDEALAAKAINFYDLCVEVNKYGIQLDKLNDQKKADIRYILENFYEFNFTI